MTQRAHFHRPVLFLATLMLLASASVSAHHSFNAYDMSRTETVTGTLKEFRWGAPHSSMVVTYRDKSGKQQVMSVVSGSPLALSKQGFTPRDFHAGDKVTVTYHPNTSGGPGGVMATLTLPDGKTYKDSEAASQRPNVSAAPAGPAPK